MLYNKELKREQQAIDCLTCPYFDKYEKKCLGIDKICFGYDPKTNTIYEFLGDYWHGNPKVHDFDKVNLNTGVSFKELNQKTFERFDEIKKLGYNIKYVWENEYNKNGLDALVDY